MAAQADKKFVQRSEVTPDYLRLLREIEKTMFYEADLMDYRQYSQGWRC